jgi:hypothetical protein
MVNIAVFNLNITARMETNSAIAAFVNIASGDSETVRVIGVHADRSTSVEPAAGDRSTGAGFKSQNTTRAEPGLRRMTGGEICDSQIVTTREFDDVGISRYGRNRSFFKTRSTESETVNVLNDQLRSHLVVAIDAIPGVIGAMGIRAVI